ncbi:MAG: hypothetical protein WCH40_04105, partial [Verrucomicrobiales bacterium]
MSTLDDKPSMVFTWLGDVDQQVAIAHLHADGKIGSAEFDKAKKSIRLTENRYSKTADGSPGFGKIEPLAAFLGKGVVYHVLSDHDAETTAYFRQWLEGRGYTVVIHPVSLRSASDYKEVYSKVDALLEEVEETHSQIDFDYGFYLAPGTRVMASVWLLLARTRFNGNVYHWA